MMPNYKEERDNLEKKIRELTELYSRTQQSMAQITQELMEARGAIKFIDKMLLESSPTPEIKALKTGDINL